MASVAPPAPTYRPVLPPALRGEGRISDAQAETAIYAGEAHGGYLPGRFRLGEARHEVTLARDDDDKAVQFRRGFFLGDGTGCGKGRQIAAIIADNISQGRTRALWLSRNDALLEDARRDWAALGGGAHDIVPLSSWKQGDAIRLDRGILFTTYATLRQAARGGRQSRLDQIVAWLGEDFEGVIAFDEAHAMANAAGGGKGARGTKKASQQGMAGLALQNRLPDARVLYVSATGATTAENLAYAARLGLWGGPEAPFMSRPDFLEAMDRGGVAAMELVARELKALGLYVARSLSFEGVEYEPLVHPLTSDDVAIWDDWADAFQVIHANLAEALKATGLNDAEGRPKSPLAASAVHSAFEGANPPGPTIASGASRHSGWRAGPPSRLPANCRTGSAAARCWERFIVSACLPEDPADRRPPEPQRLGRAERTRWTGRPNGLQPALHRSWRTARELPTGGLTILTVRRGQCRWPYGDPAHAGFSFCGRPVARGAFCLDHAELGYRTPPGGAPSLLNLAGLA